MSEEALSAQFFVTRNDGRMVPLIAVDELPHHIIITGVSRVMSPFDITGMTCVGRSDFRHRSYTVEEASELAANNTVAGRDTLKAKYFITRDSGNMVPLVAMDEMPAYFIIKSVPRSVSVFDIAGMTCVGLAETRETFHQVEDVKNAPMSYFTERTGAASAFDDSSAATGATPESTSPSFGIPTQTPNGQALSQLNSSPFPPLPDFGGEAHMLDQPLLHLSRPTSVAPSEFGTGLHIVPRPTAEPSTITSTKSSNMPGTKEYCSYWIRHGECDYQQQGCLYKHEMPLDQETLSRLGLRDIPRWYREKHSLGSYLAAGGSGAAFSGQDLKSAAASGIHEDDKQNKMAGNWRSAPRIECRTPSPSTRHGNIYDPRSSRPVIDPSSFSRISSSKPHTPLFNGANEISRGYPRFETFPPFGTRGRSNSNRRRNSPQLNRRFARGENSHGSPSAQHLVTSREHRQSVSTIMSDVEASVGREDAIRRAKEEADYARIKGEEDQSVTDKSVKSSIEPKKAEGTSDRRGLGGNRRGGRMSSGRGRFKNRIQKTDNAA